MRLIFAGTPEAAVPTLRALAGSEHEVLAVVTRPDAKTGRGQMLSPSPVAVAAEELGLPILKASRSSEIANDLLDLHPDVAVIVAFGSLIREPLLTAWPWVNVHFSLLPMFRGAAPVQHALLAGEEITGVTTFILNEGMDTGPILGQMTERVRPDDTSGSLLSRLSESGAHLLLATLDQWKEITPVSQSNDGASVAPKITSAMAQIDWSRSAEMVERHVRAMSPSPGAWTHLGEQRLEVLRVAMNERQLQPGAVIVEKNLVLVGTGTTALELIEVKPQGKRAMAAADWARGLRHSEIRFA